MTNILYVKAFALDIYDNVGGQPAALLYYSASSYVGQPTAAPLAMYYGATNPTATPYATFPDDSTGLDYYAATQAQALVDLINGQIGSVFYTSYDVEKVDAPVGAALNAISASITASMAGKTDEAGFAALTALGAHGIANGLDNAPVNAPTNLTVLSILSNELNSTNGKQNTIGSNLNDLADKFNTLLTYATSLETKLNATISAGAA